MRPFTASRMARSSSVISSRSRWTVGSVMVHLRRIGAEDAEQTRARANLDERVSDDRVERVAGEDGVEPVLPGGLGYGSRHELEEIDVVPRERLDRPVERARLVVGHERERRAP